MSFKLSLAASLALLIAIFVSVHDRINIISRPQNSSSDHDEQNLHHLEVIQIGGGALGPESFAFSGRDGGSTAGGGPYTGVSDGRIIKWQRNESRWIDFAVTSPQRNGCEGSHDHSRKEEVCGRPLGLRFNDNTGDLFIADAHMGLLVVGPTGGLAAELVKEAQGIPLGFTNSLDIDQTSGVVYFTDSSTRYQRRNYVSLIVSGDRSGRLLKYDPRTHEVNVLLNNLAFPNGVALSKDGDFILLAETTSCRILKFWLEPSSRAGAVEVINGELPGFPDNIKRNQKGEFWVAINSRREKFLKWTLSYAWLRTALSRLPFDITSAYSYLADFYGCGLAIKLNESGEILEILEDKKGKRWKYVSEVVEEDGNLWIGSVKMPFAVKLKISKKKPN